MTEMILLFFEVLVEHMVPECILKKSLYVAVGNAHGRYCLVFFILVKGLEVRRGF